MGIINRYIIRIYEGKEVKDSLPVTKDELDRFHTALKELAKKEKDLNFSFGICGIENFLEMNRDVFDKVLDWERIQNQPTESKEYQQMKALYARLLETWRKKNADYGNSFDKGIQKRGYVSALCRMDDKFNRIDELLSSGVQLVDDETVKDTLLDLANYCVMLVRYIQEKENEIN